MKKKSKEVRKQEIQKEQVDVEMDPPILIMKNKTNETWLIQNTSNTFKTF